MYSRIENEFLMNMAAREIIRGPRRLMLLGVVNVVLGSAAVIIPHIATLAMELLVGGLLLVHGIAGGIHLVQQQNKPDFGWRLFGALTALIAGGLLLVFPPAGVLSLTLILGIFFLITGVSKLVTALVIRPLEAWGWLLFSGLIDLALVALLVYYWPQIAIWFIGLLVGISFIFNGWWFILAAWALRKIERT